MTTPPVTGASSFAENRPMPVFRPAATRGRLQHDGVDSVHSFSSGDYVDRDRMGFGALRVLADVSVAPGVTLPPQRRANMQILTWVRCGVLAWSDGAGVSGELHGGCVQLLDAGHGSEQAERNPSAEHPVELVRLWLQPETVNAVPRRVEAWFDDADRQGRWQTLAGPDDGAGALPLRGGARVRVARILPEAPLDLAAAAGARAWLQVLHGTVRCGERTLAAGDALEWASPPVEGELRAVGTPADLLLVEVPSA